VSGGLTQQQLRQAQRGGSQDQQAAAAQRHKQQQQQDGGGPTATKAPSQGKVIKIPKLPMVQFGNAWYRAKLMKDVGARVMLEYQGFSHEGGPFWLPKDHPRIWRGSYKGRDWRHLVRA
jgi:hypothetical protein